jgi:hypothetical protein
MTFFIESILPSPDPDKPELKIEDLLMSLAQRRRLRRVSLRPF